ncbi:MAG: plasmid maintenance system killer [Bacteroidetes bacterium QS_9_68_14]|nr:MAG: plasmid maintenance system killer [Bacteroidetes bacterium QS_9_68_14]
MTRNAMPFSLRGAQHATKSESVVIASFADEKTERIFRRWQSRKLPTGIQKRARDKLLLLDNATCERDLRPVPGLRHEPSAGDWPGPWRLRISKRWSLCFEWQDGSARAVQIVARPR